MREYPLELKTDMLARLRRIEGQARGVQRMIDEGRDCREVLQQLAAVRSASHQASLRLVRHAAVHCLEDPTTSADEVVGQLVDILAKMPP